MRLSGESMEPFLPNGARILVRGDSADRIALGDLLVYDANGQLVCHRVLRRSGRRGEVSFLTRGDHGWTPPAWVPGGHVLGKVLAVERDGTVSTLDTARSRLEAAARALRSLAVGRLSTAIYLGRRLAACLGTGTPGR